MEEISLIESEPPNNIRIPDSVNYCFSCKNYSNTDFSYIKLQRKLAETEAKLSECSDYDKHVKKTLKYKDKLEDSINTNNTFIYSFLINSVISVGLLIFVI